VPIDFLDDALDPHGLAVEIHLLAILCNHTLASASFSSCPSLLPIHPFIHSFTHLFIWNLGSCRVQNVLNLMYNVLGSVDVRGNSCVVMFMPDERAVGGRNERKSRAGRARAEKGLKRVVTSVIKRVIIFVEMLISLLGVSGRKLGLRDDRFLKTAKSSQQSVW